MRFVAVILGVLIEEPIMLDPAMRMPLYEYCLSKSVYLHSGTNDGKTEGESNAYVGPRVWISAIPNISPSGVFFILTDKGTHFCSEII